VRKQAERGFTLIEVLVTVAIVALVAAAAGTLFLAGASPAVAAATRDVHAAFAEARRTAAAFDAATVVFAPRPAGGYSARVYERIPGDPGFRARSGPAYESAVTIAETAAPLGPPGFAFAVDRRGNMSAYVHFRADLPATAPVACPAAGAFVLRLALASQTAGVNVPCNLPSSATAAATFATPPAFASAVPATPAACPSGAACALLPPAPPAPAVCPPGDAPDSLVPGLCDPLATASPAFVQNATPPAGPSAAPTPAGTASPALCVAGAPDAAGFAACIADNPVRVLGAAITHSSCGTHMPVNDPGPAFTLTVEIDRQGSMWATYAITMLTIRGPWLNFEDVPPAQTCGLAYTLGFRIGSIAPLAGNARVSPAADTGDPGLADQGLGWFTEASGGFAFGSNS
jgi:prepilin-type N-terminal cleavage/methylation domain-containing protein